MNNDKSAHDRFHLHRILLAAAMAIVGAVAARPVEGIEIRNPSTGLCVDSFGRHGAVMMHPCHGDGGNQDWVFDRSSGELKNPSSDLCLDSWGRPGEARMNGCHGHQGNQRWVFDTSTGELRNPSSDLCLDSWGRPGEARMYGCHGHQGNQRFAFSARHVIPDRMPVVPPAPEPTPAPLEPADTVIEFRNDSIYTVSYEITTDFAEPNILSSVDRREVKSGKKAEITVPGDAKVSIKGEALKVVAWTEVFNHRDLSFGAGKTWCYTIETGFGTLGWRRNEC